MASDSPKLKPSAPRNGPLPDLRRSFFTVRAQDLTMQEYLREMFDCTDKLAEAERHNELIRRNLRKFALHWYTRLSSEQTELMFDTIIMVMIVFNALFQGIALDYSDGSAPWVLVDAMFTTIFITEIAFKVRVHGFHQFFCGRWRLANNFDAGLVFVDLCQLFVLVVTPEFARTSMRDVPAASLIRMMKLFKLTRLLRLLTAEVFRDLLTMIQGILGGFPTLVWAMILFFLVVYIMALFFKEFFGKEDVEFVQPYFETVPRSMLTTFRCAFGDCNSAEGAPIFEQVHKHYGWFASAFYCLFVFTTAVGIMNVIAAIFVESTMAAASGLEYAKKEARLRDTAIWSTRVTAFVRLLAIQSGVRQEVQGSELAEKINALELPAEVIDAVVQTDEGREALLDLDVNAHDHPYLSDILDADGSGACGMFEIIDGLRRLRGEPRRSDIVCVDLRARDLQRQLNEVLARVRRIDERP